MPLETTIYFEALPLFRDGKLSFTTMPHTKQCEVLSWQWRSPPNRGYLTGPDELHFIKHVDSLSDELKMKQKAGKSFKDCLLVVKRLPEQVNYLTIRMECVLIKSIEPQEPDAKGQVEIVTFDLDDGYHQHLHSADGKDGYFSIRRIYEKK